MRLRVLAVPAALLVVYACIPHPDDDYDKFLEATKDMRGSTTTSDAAVDAKPPVDPVKGSYFAACYSDLMASNLHKTLRFYVQTEFVPEGTGGNLTLKFYPLKATTRTIAQSEAVGNPFEFKSPVAADGKFSASTDKADVNGQANPLSGRDITLSPVALNGRFGDKDKFCSRFTGKIVVPITQDFEAACLFFAQKDNATFALANDPSGPSESLSLDNGATTAKLGAAGGNGDFICN
jgi:hypothetical protein